MGHDDNLGFVVIVLSVCVVLAIFLGQCCYHLGYSKCWNEAKERGYTQYNSETGKREWVYHDEKTGTRDN